MKPPEERKEAFVDEEYQKEKCGHSSDESEEAKNRQAAVDFKALDQRDKYTGRKQLDLKDIMQNKMLTLGLQGEMKKMMAEKIKMMFVNRKQSIGDIMQIKMKQMMGIKVDADELAKDNMKAKRVKKVTALELARQKQL